MVLKNTGNKGVISIVFLLLVTKLFAAGINDLQIVAKKVLDTSGFSCDLAMDPRNGNLHVLWVKNGDLKHIVRYFTGSWGDVETIDDGGRTVYGQEEADVARKCSAIDVDDNGNCHIVFASAGGDLYYITGRTGAWSEPLRIVSKGPYSIYTDIIYSKGNIYVVYEDSDPDKIYSVICENGQWKSPEYLENGEYPALYKGEDGVVYFLCRGPNTMQHNAKFGRLVPGETGWIINRNVTDAPRRLGHGPGMAIGNGKIYIAWNSSTGVEYSDKKTELYCAIADIPGDKWTSRLGDGIPIYYENTGDPHSRVAVYSDGLVLYMNGARNERFAVWDGDEWSDTRIAPWNEGYSYSKKMYLDLENDGKTVWVASSRAGSTDGEVAVSGISNPNASSKFENLTNDAAKLSIIQKTVLDEQGFSGRIAIDPINGALHAIWVEDGDIYHSVKNLSSQSWTESETVPDGGAFVSAKENDSFLRFCVDIDIDDNSTIHVVFASDDGKVYYIYKQQNGSWSAPNLIAETQAGAIYPSIAAVNGVCTVVYQDVEDSSVYSAKGKNQSWQAAEKIAQGLYPALERDVKGMLYLIFKGLPLKSKTYFSSCIPGFTDWKEPWPVLTAGNEVGAEPGIFTGQGKILIAWNNNTGVIGDFKSEMFCAVGDQSGDNWNPSISDNIPLYYENTSDPHPRAAFYSDGKILYLNGRRFAERFMVINGAVWSETRAAPWGDGIPDITCDGRTVWVIVSITGSNSGEVTVSGISNPDADVVRFDSTVPKFTSHPDTTAFAGQQWSYMPSVDDEDTNSVEFSIIESPQNMSIDHSTGQLTWTPSQDDLDSDLWGKGSGVFLTGILVTDEHGRSSSQYFWIYVHEQNRAPVITSSPVLTCYVDSTYVYDVTASDPDGDNITFSLEHSPQSMTIQSSSGRIEWIPAIQDTGANAVTVRVTDSFNAYTEQQFNITVTKKNTPPTAAFSSDTTKGVIPVTIRFTDESTGDISSRLWFFGDDSTSTEKDPVHTYYKAGQYSVKLIVSGQAGTDTLEKINYIKAIEPPPVADFSANPVNGEAPLSVQFTDLSTGQITAWAWDFGDGGTSTEQNPLYVFNDAGEYTITLIVTGAGGSTGEVKESYIKVSDPNTGLVNSSGVPEKYYLYQNYPNPFNGSTVIKYDIAEPSIVRISIYSMMGEKVAELVNSYKLRGSYTVLWNGRGISGMHAPSGIYLLRIDAGKFTERRKIILIK